MLVAANGREAGKAGVAGGNTNLSALVIGHTEICGAHAAVASTGPCTRHQACWQVLRVNALLHSSRRAAPDFPGRLRVSQLFQEPLLLLRAKDRLRRFFLAPVRNILIAISDRVRRMPVVILATCIDDLKYLLRQKLRKILVGEISVIEIRAGVF